MARLFPRRSPPRLLTAAARGGLRPPPAQRPRRATRPPGPAPPSLAQHRIQRLGLLHPASFNVRVHTKRGKAGVRPRTRAARKEWSGPALSAVRRRCLVAPIAAARRSAAALLLVARSRSARSLCLASE